jgi:hypothetical protein
MDDSRFIVAIVVRETEPKPPKPPTSPTSSSPRRTRPRHPIRRLWLRPCRRDEKRRQETGMLKPSELAQRS